MGETTEKVIQLNLPSSTQLVYVLDVVISEILREMGFDEQTSEQVNLAVIEAGTNAIKHGNNDNPDKRAHFEFMLSEDKITIVVQDEGPGFDREAVADPLDPANLLKSSGRGLFLMEACMDSVVYEQTGSTVRMVKYKTGGEQMSK